MLNKANVFLFIIITAAVVVVFVSVVDDWCSSVLADAMMIEIESLCVSAVVSYRVGEQFDTPSEISRFSTLINCILKSFIFKQQIKARSSSVCMLVKNQITV